ncbi:MAG: 1-acyl-sn-glycerol-3-phosphate acyltransferase [bacterium]
MKKFYKCIFLLAGWKAVGKMPDGIRKCVIISAPHTSAWDFVLGRIAFSLLGLQGKFFIKKEFFFFPLGILLKYMGGIPVDRKKGEGQVRTALRYFQKSDDFILVLTPEGTRKCNHNWKRGFYRIAEDAKVPLLLGFLDYKKKEVGFMQDPVFEATGDYQKDLQKIYARYKDVHAKYPKNFNLTT